MPAAPEISSKGAIDPPQIEEAVRNFTKCTGFLTLYKDANENKLYLEIRDFDRPFLYIPSMATGIGSSKIGLDRGQMPWEAGDLVEFQRNGNSVFLVQLNDRFRAPNADDEFQETVEKSFATSRIAHFKIKAATGERTLIDITEFVTQDGFDAVEALNEHGTYKRSGELSSIDMSEESTNSFPRNTEIEVTLTFVGKPNDETPIKDGIVPDPSSITLNQHHSFVALPDPPLPARRFDPRVGFFNVAYVDLSQPIESPLEQRIIMRQRLDPKKEDSIVFYVDRTAPENIQRHLIEGANWWKEAFGEIGMEHAFNVKVLPPGVSPLDIRYNVILWNPRSTRGWSYARMVTDPRTGEILKGQVVIDAMRVRHLFGILASFEPPFSMQESEQIAKLKAIAYRRLHQLVAHEVGHTLGLRHNFAASRGKRNSVMDYPFPLLKYSKNGEVDLRSSYASGVGNWDKIAIEYGYRHFENTEEEEGLREILSRVIKNPDFKNFSDEDSSGYFSGIHPDSVRWDNGKNPLSDLRRLINLRRAALAELGDESISAGVSNSFLEDRLRAIYFSHSFGAEAVASQIGGMFYGYSFKGEKGEFNRFVSARRQRDALTLLLETLSPTFLSVPEDLIRSIPPRPLGYEDFPYGKSARLGRTIDLLGLAESCANHTLTQLFDLKRCNRLVEYRSRSGSGFGFMEMSDEVISKLWADQPQVDPIHREILRTVRSVALYHLMRLAADTNASSQVRALAGAKLREIEQDLSVRGNQESDPREAAHLLFTLEQIRRFRLAPEKKSLSKPLELEKLSPLGCYSSRGGH